MKSADAIVLYVLFLYLVAQKCAVGTRMNPVNVNLFPSSAREAVMTNILN